MNCRVYFAPQAANLGQLAWFPIGKYPPLPDSLSKKSNIKQKGTSSRTLALVHTGLVAPQDTLCTDVIYTWSSMHPPWCLWNLDQAQEAYSERRGVSSPAEWSGWGQEEKQGWGPVVNRKPEAGASPWLRSKQPCPSASISTPNSHFGIPSAHLSAFGTPLLIWLLCSETLDYTLVCFRGLENAHVDTSVAVTSVICAQVFCLCHYRCWQRPPGHVLILQENPLMAKRVWTFFFLKWNLEKAGSSLKTKQNKKNLNTEQWVSSWHFHGLSRYFAHTYHPYIPSPILPSRTTPIIPQPHFSHSLHQTPPSGQIVLITFSFTHSVISRCIVFLFLWPLLRTSSPSLPSIPCYRHESMYTHVHAHTQI